LESLRRWGMWDKILGFLLLVGISVVSFFTFLWNLPSLIRDYYRYRRLTRM
jgi:hypothetical protein